ncbi:hypothetical protein L3C95_30100 [Chitinophaga filiformis]|uniref:hypothetical protein n=1 Tax=Chitinophaga filiformis TaxID=104663 RepID=UPI001F38465E|nr:hypothetical protein [Chitinophaga filiformis]MCF6407187.1 hypothetical protein [Chitinophaga filiformis]
MRKLLLAVAVLSISLFACKKDTAPTNPNPSPPATSTETFPVSFSVSSFLQKQEQLATPGGRKTGTGSNLRDSVLAGKVSHLYYLLYNDYGQFVKVIFQNTTDNPDDFGTLEENLPANRYIIALIASTGPIQLLDTTSYYSMRLRLPDATLPNLNVSAPDIFVGSNTFTVTGYGATQTVPLWPTRIMGRLEVNILDAPEASGPGDSTIQVYTSPAYRQYIQYGNYDEIIAEPGIVLQRNGRTNFSSQVLTPFSEITVTIAYPDKTTGERKLKEMRFVPFTRGYRTVMTGNVYNPLGGGTGFSIALDTTWYDYVNIPF